MTKLTELTTQLQAVDAHLSKVKDEIFDKIQTLEAALTNITLPMDADLALSALKTKVQTLDDIVPDPAE